MSKKIKTCWVVLCAVLLVFTVVFAGCNGSEANEGGSAADEITCKAQLYYVNEAYVVGGDETLGHFKLPEEMEITASPSADIYKAVLDALKEVPEGEDYDTFLKNAVKINGASAGADGKIITVDFSAEGLTGGSTEETLLVEQIVWTLLKTFDGVEQVLFTVDGKTAETLMGHLDTSVPYTLMRVDDGSGKQVETVMPVYE